MILSVPLLYETVVTYKKTSIGFIFEREYCLENEAVAVIEPGMREKTFTEKGHITRAWIFNILISQSEPLVILGPIWDCRIKGGDLGWSVLVCLVIRAGKIKRGVQGGGFMVNYAVL